MKSNQICQKCHLYMSKKSIFQKLKHLLSFSINNVLQFWFYSVVEKNTNNKFPDFSTFDGLPFLSITSMKF